MAAISGPAHAQALICAVPAQVGQYRAPASSPQPKRDIPIAGYTLALTWSPEYCRTRTSAVRDSFQCGGKNQFGFTLHGLWPEGAGKNWPQYCRPAGVIAQKTIRENMCTMPSEQLIRHEWARHGTCMAARPEAYLQEARVQYGRIRYPDMAALSRQPLTAGQFAKAFAAVNPGLRADMFGITGPRGWLQEIRICLDRKLNWARCPVHQKGILPAARLRIWRGS